MESCKFDNKIDLVIVKGVSCCIFRTNRCVVVWDFWFWYFSVSMCHALLFIPSLCLFFCPFHSSPGFYYLITPCVFRSLSSLPSRRQFICSVLPMCFLCLPVLFSPMCVSSFWILYSLPYFCFCIFCFAFVSWMFSCFLLYSFCCYIFGFWMLCFVLGLTFC